MIIDGKYSEEELDGAAVDVRWSKADRTEFIGAMQAVQHQTIP